MSITNIFSHKANKPPKRRDRQAEANREHAMMLILKRISSQYNWAEGEARELLGMITNINRLNEDVTKLGIELEGRLADIEALMGQIDIDQETLIKAAKYDEQRSKTRMRVRRFREKRET